MRITEIRSCILVAAIFFEGCFLDQTHNTILMNSEVIKHIDINGRTVDFIVTGSAPASCYEFWHGDYFKIADTYTSRLYAVQTSTVCLASFIHIDGNISIKVDSAGTYVFRFEGGYGSDIDTTLVIE